MADTAKLFIKATTSNDFKQYLYQKLQGKLNIRVRQAHAKPIYGMFQFNTKELIAFSTVHISVNMLQFINEKLDRDPNDTDFLNEILTKNNLQLKNNSPAVVNDKLQDIELQFTAKKLYEYKVELIKKLIERNPVKTEEDIINHFSKQGVAYTSENLLHLLEVSKQAIKPQHSRYSKRMPAVQKKIYRSKIEHAYEQTKQKIKQGFYKSEEPVL